MALELAVSDHHWYVPKFGGNRARYEAGTDPDPCLVQLRPATWQATRQLNRALDPDTGKLSDEENLTFLREHVGEIRGLRLGPDAITSGVQLVQHARKMPVGFIGELTTAILSFEEFTRGLKNGLRSPHGSADSPRTSGGIAETVGGGGSTS